MAWMNEWLNEWIDAEWWQWPLSSPSSRLLFGLGTGISGVNLVWNLGGRWSGSKHFDFSRQISEKFRFFRQFHKKFRFFQENFWKISFFLGKFLKSFDFFQANFKQISIFQAIYKQFRFYRQKLLTHSYFWANFSISLKKSPAHHFRTYFLYTIRYNNISRPVHDHPYSPLPKLWGSRPPQLPRIDVPDRKVCAMTVTPTPTNTLLTIHQNITRLASADWRPKISFWKAVAQITTKPLHTSKIEIYRKFRNIILT